MLVLLKLQWLIHDKQRSVRLGVRTRVRVRVRVSVSVLLARKASRDGGVSRSGEVKACHELP